MLIGINGILPANEIVAEIWTVCILIFIIISFLFVISLTYRRLHDMGQAGWLWILYIIPVIDTFYFLILCFYPGSNSANQYGDLPKPEINLETILGK